MSVQENIDKVAKAMDKVRNHCMCGRFEDDGARFTVFYPDGDFPVNGVRVAYNEKGKAWALTKMLEKMELHWMESYL